MPVLHRLAPALLLIALPLQGVQAQDNAASVDDQLNAVVERVVDASQGIEIDDATVVADGAFGLARADACEFSRLLNGDEICTTSAVIFPPQDVPIHSIYYEPPENIGFVDMEDWTEGASEEIDLIWESFVEGAKEQSARLGYHVRPVKWLLYPTLDKETQVMNYAMLFDFGGEEVVNVTSVKFKRNGYVVMKIVTDETMLAESGASFADVAAYASRSYRPDAGLRYADFQDGDEVAAIGAVGVLAAVMGVKYANKGTLAALAAAALLFLKKFWFLLLAIPAALWAGIRRLAGRGKAG